MSEVRCPACKANNGRQLEGTIEIKCRRCGALLQASSLTASNPPVVLVVPAPLTT